MQRMASDQSWLTWLMQINMKPSIILAIVLALCSALIAGGGTKLLTADPLAGLPLYPATDSRLHLGNDPTRLPESNVCKSKMQADFYTIYDSKVDATLVWYDAHLPGFKQTHAYAANRSQDTFYNADGTLPISVTGSSGKAGENTETYVGALLALSARPSGESDRRPQSAKARLPVTLCLIAMFRTANPTILGRLWLRASTGSAAKEVSNNRFTIRTSRARVRAC